MKYLALFLLFVFWAVQLQAQQWRVVAKVYQKYSATATSYTKEDSTTYSYNYQTNRGSSPNNDTIECDKLKYYVFGNSAYTLLYEQLYKYNTDNSVSSIAKYSAHPDTKQWVVSATDTIHFTNGIRIAQTHHKLHYTGGKFVLLQYDDINYTYNINGLVANVVNTSINRSWNYYLYDTAGRLVLDSSWLPNPTVPTLYLMWLQTAYKYDTAGRLKEKVVYQIDTPQNSIKSTRYYIYDIAGLLIKDSILEFISGGVVTNRKIHRYTYNTNGRLVTDTFSSSGTNHLSTITTYTYTSFGRIDEIEITEYNASTNSIIDIDKTKYYYEHYWPLEVSNNSQVLAWQPQECTLFPNPAKGVLYIIWVEKGLENVEGRIIDLQGRVLQQWSDLCSSRYNKTINMASLSSGNYYVELHTNLGEVHKPFVILK